MSQQDWDAAKWPAVCLDFEHLFNAPHARLFPLIADRRSKTSYTVRTPAGRGRLLYVSKDVCHVAMNHPAEHGRKGQPLVEYFHPLDVWPDT